MSIDEDKGGNIAAWDRKSMFGREEEITMDDIARRGSGTFKGRDCFEFSLVIFSHAAAVAGEGGWKWAREKVTEVESFSTKVHVAAMDEIWGMGYRVDS